MHGGRMIKASTAALALASGLAAVSGAGHAADLGGNCCADLEERIAELEATTARKGNRKVSLEIYGQVNQEILFWDDGFESNAGVYTNDNSRTRFGFRGKAKIDSDWEAGYRLEIGVRSANSKRFTQDNPDGNPDVGLDLRDSYWYLKSKTFGAGSVGRQATATDQITELNLTQTAEFAKYSDQEDTGLGLLLRRTDGTLSTTLQTRRLIGDGGDQPGEGERRADAVKYVSPEFAGFTASAAWGNDDIWDVALRYKGEFAGVELVAGIGYGEITDGIQTLTTGFSGLDVDAKQWGGSFSAIHTATGLFLNFGAGAKQDDGLTDIALFSGNVGPDDESWFWSLQAGIEKKWHPLGKTTIYGEYYDLDGSSLSRRPGSSSALDPIQSGLAITNAGTTRAAILDTGLTSYGVGVAQGIDAAALVLYLTYRHYEPDLTLVGVSGSVATGPSANVSLEDIDVVTAGGIIKF